MALYSTKRYVDVLEDIVDNYNTYKLKREKKKVIQKQVNDLKKTDRVRVYMKALEEYRKNKFKPLTTYWSENVYRVRKVIRPKTEFDIFHYVLNNGRQYNRNQLQKINRIEKLKKEDKKKEKDEEEIEKKEKVTKIVKDREGLDENNVIKSKRVRKQRDLGFYVSE